MLFKYTALTRDGAERQGSVDALDMDIAIKALQKRGLVVSSIEPEKDSWFAKDITFFNQISNKDVVILSRQISTLFGAKISALRAFRLLAEESDNPSLQTVLTQVADDIQGGLPMSDALSKHPDVFSQFYVSLVKTGEESGRLEEIFLYLADYLDRMYEITSKAKHAFVYPAVVVFIFLVVMILMFTVIIPQIAQIILDAGQDIPIYTEIVIGISHFLVNYGIYLFVALVALIGGFYYWLREQGGSSSFDHFKIQIPLIGGLYRQLYLTRIADNLSTMIISGVSMVRSLEVTSEVVGNARYREILEETISLVRSGKTVSESFAQFEEIPGIMTQMIRAGEETGSIGDVLEQVSKFYRREFTTKVDTMVSLIEPILIVALGLGVGALLASVLIPIYDITSSIG